MKPYILREACGSMSEMVPLGQYFDPDTPEFAALSRKAKNYYKGQAEIASQMTLEGGHLDPSEHAGFGRFGGLPPEVPTMNELAITQFLDANDIDYTLHKKLGEDFPEYGFPRIEYDVYIPSKHIAIEVSPAFHNAARIKAYLEKKDIAPEGRKNLSRVLRNDEIKKRAAQEHGIELVSIDPQDTANKFSDEINKKLIPVLRQAGYHVPDLYVDTTVRRRK
jgi:hypothetical protein